VRIMGVKDYYDRLAGVYDSLYKNKYMRVVERRIISEFVDREDFVLDIGCGTGEHLKILNKAIGLDISLEMSKIAREKTDKFVVVGNAEFLPFKNRSFDVVVSFFGALNHCNLNRAVREVRRVLKDDGIFIFTVANVYDAKWILRNAVRGNFKKIKKAIRKRRGVIIKNIGDEKIRVNTRFYDKNEVESILKKENFKIICTFGANITGSPLDRFIYKTFLKNFASYIGFVAKKC